MKFIELPLTRRIVQIALILWAGYVIALFSIHQHHSLESIPFDLPRIAEFLFIKVVIEAIWGIVFVIIAYGLGRFVLDLLRISQEIDSLEDDIIFSIATGFGLIGLGTFLLGTIGLLQVWLHVGLGVILVALTHRKILNLFGNIKKSWFWDNKLSRIEIFIMIMIGGIIVWGLPTFFYPLHGFDSFDYHLPAPLTYIREGRISFHPEIHFNNFPGTVEMWFLQSMLVLPEGATQFLMGICHLVTTLAVFAMTKRFFDRGSALIATLVYMLIRKVFLFATLAFIDQGLTLMVVLGTYATIRYIEKPSKSLAILVGLMMGFACGIKYSAIITMLILGLVVVVFEFVGKKEFKRLAIDFGLAIVLLILVSCAWYIRNWVWFHNPVFPFFSGVFPTDGGMYAQYIEDLKIEHSRMLVMFSLGARKTILWFLSLPYMLTFEPFGPYDKQGVGVVGPWFLLSLPLVIFLKRIPKVLIVIVALIVTTYGYWFFFEKMLHLRYMLPVFSIQAVLAGYLFWQGLKPDSFKFRSVGQWLSLTIIFCLLITYFAGMVIPRQPRRRFPVLPAEQIKIYNDHMNAYQVVLEMNEIARDEVGEEGDPWDVRMYGFYMEQYRWIAEFTLVGNQVGYADHETYRNRTSTARELYDWLKEYDIDYLIVNVPFASISLGEEAQYAAPGYRDMVMTDWEQYFELINSYYYVWTFKLK